ncbi:MAG: hypothetical protein RMM29_08490 [Planctomycetota bacterium]|nr:hypothetical protein [Planctomycetota bacterium]MDW8373665.1 hypothetical protein [Planctomycetota bacterium]
MTRIALALAALGMLAALETPLTLQSLQGNRTVVIDPAFGPITLFELTTSAANRISGIRQPQVNFLADLELRAKSYADERDGIPFQWLRIGENTKPAYGDTYMMLPDKPTRREARANKRALRWRALRSENAFWKDEPKYDGVVRAAMTSTGQHLLLGIPSLHALLVYRIDGDALKLVAVRNYGIDLFIPGYNTSPAPQELMQEAMKRARTKEDEARFRSVLGLDEESQPAEGAAGDSGSGDEPALKSDIWVGPGERESFVVIDIVNARALLYRVDKEFTLAAVRDLSIDLAVPGLVGGSLRSEPAGQRLLDEFLNVRKKEIAEFGLPTKDEEILALVGQRQAAGKASPFEAISQPNAGLVFCNFADRRVLLSFEVKGASSLRLIAARDYTIDVAVTMLDQEIQDRIAARQLLERATQLANGGKPKTALLTLRRALALDPRLHAEAEKQIKGAYARQPAEMQKTLGELLEEAAKKAAELAKQAEERRKMAEQLQKGKKKDGGQR